MSITIDQLENGQIARLKLGNLKILANESTSTLYRKIKSGKLIAQTDPGTNRLYISRADALTYLKAQPQYRHNHLNADSISKMEHARQFKNVDIKGNRKRAKTK